MILNVSTLRSAARLEWSSFLLLRLLERTFKVIT